MIEVAGRGGSGESWDLAVLDLPNGFDADEIDGVPVAPEVGFSEERVPKDGALPLSKMLEVDV